MGLDDLINKAKDMLGGAQHETEGAAASAAAGDVQGAKEQAHEASGLIDKAKEMLTDERIDSVAGAIKDKTPDNIDTVVDTVAAKAKDLNN